MIDPDRFRALWDEDLDRKSHPGHWIGKTNRNSANRCLISIEGENRALKRVMREVFYPTGGHGEDPCPYELCVHPNHRFSRRAIEALPS